MANQEHVEILMRGVEVWNRWREKHPEIKPDIGFIKYKANLGGINLTNANLFQAFLPESNFTNADFTEADLTSAVLSGGSDLRGANFSQAVLCFVSLAFANLQGANFSHAALYQASFLRADLRYAILREAELTEVDFREANLSYTDLSGSNLNESILLRANMAHANLNACAVYGIAAWDVQLEGATQTNLIITRSDQPTITVDNLEVAQFIYFLLNNEKVRDVITTVTTKVVLILGRFTARRKRVLDGSKLNKRIKTLIGYNFYSFSE